MVVADAPTVVTPAFWLQDRVPWPRILQPEQRGHL